MTDVFISYAHEDQNFARRMVPALEAEGFTVWWDHTIPPGQTWDTFIARGIEDARCCIVLWSGRSVGSDWVKEEATLAKDAGKLIPVQLDAENPPVGFRRIQAAQLIGWTGDVNNNQWKMLVQEVRRIVGASRAGSSPAPRPAADYEAPSYQNYEAPTRQSGKGPPLAIIGAIAAVAIIGVLAVPMLTRAPANVTTETASTVGATTTAAPDSAEIERLRQQNAESARQSQAEIARLQRERDAAIESERVQRAAASTQRQQRQAAPPVASLVGNWSMRRRWDGDSWADMNLTMTFMSDGRFEPSDAPADSGTWRQNGNSISFRYSGGAQTSYSGTINGNFISGRFSTGSGAGDFELRRQ